MVDKLTDKQEQFCQEYLIDLNATQAAIRAGYSEKTARSVGCENLTKPDIVERIAERQKERAERMQISQDKVLSELSKLGFSNMLDYTREAGEGFLAVDVSEITRDQAAAIQEITVDHIRKKPGDDDDPGVDRVKLKLCDKRAALVDIGKHLGMFVERSQVKHSGDTKWTVEVVRPKDVKSA